MPGPVLDTLTRLGDAVAGVNPMARFKGTAEVDEIQARTEAALALARERRVQAEQAQMERDALERIQGAAQSTFTDPNTIPIGDLVLGKRGSDFSGVMEGRNRAQTFGEHATVDTPAPLGDVAAEANRQAALDSLAPAAAVALRKPATAARPGAPVVVEGDEGPVYETPAGAIGKKPGARPVAPRPAPIQGPTAQERNIDALKQRGVPEDLAIQIVYNDVKDPRADYVRIKNELAGQKDAAFRPIYTPEQADAAALASIEAIYGVGALQRANAGPTHQPQPAPANDQRPPLDSFFR